MDASIGKEARQTDGCLVPPVGCRQCGEARNRNLSPGDMECGEYADGADEPVEVGAVGLGSDYTAEPVGERIRQVPFFDGPGSSETNLSQHMGETAHAAVHSIAVPRGDRDLGDCHRPRDPRTVIPAHLVQHPSPRNLGETAVRLGDTRDHLPMMPSQDRHDRRSRLPTSAHRQSRLFDLAGRRRVLDMCAPWPIYQTRLSTDISWPHRSASSGVGVTAFARHTLSKTTRSLPLENLQGRTHSEVISTSCLGYGPEIGWP